jgi:predicted N-acetyltransferase YhbS
MMNVKPLRYAVGNLGSSNPDAMNIETFDLRTIREADARAIAELIVSIWPKIGRTVESFTADILRQGKEYRGPESQHPRSFLIREGGRVVAHSGAASRTIGTSQGDIAVLALARVCTDPIVRGRRLGDAVVRATFELVDNGTFPFSLFQTSQDVRPFYERLGATVIDNRFVNSLAENPTADPFWAEVRMRYPATGDWPTGEIDLRGPGW